ncbi:hypothetical protein GCM10027051_35910 [Niabella terrae]
MKTTHFRQVSTTLRDNCPLRFCCNNINIDEIPDGSAYDFDATIVDNRGIDNYKRLAFFKRAF